MSADRDVTRIVRSWLDEGVTVLPDRVLDEVLDQLPATPQRRASWLAWRFQPVNSSMVRVALVAAAVVVIALVGFQFLGNSDTGGPGATETPQPTATPELPAGGSHVLWDAPGEIQISVTIPDSGWFGDVGSGFITKDNNPDPPAGAGVIVFQGPLYVYGDRCHWATTRPQRPATTVGEILAALEAHGGTPLSSSVGGYDAALIVIRVPDDAEFADCDEGEFRSWVGDPVADNARFHQGPGQMDLVWVVDVNGTPVVIDAGAFDGTTAATMEEIDAIAHSAVFELP